MDLQYSMELSILAILVFELFNTVFNGILNAFLTLDDNQRRSSYLGFRFLFFLGQNNFSCSFKILIQQAFTILFTYQFILTFYFLDYLSHFSILDVYFTFELAFALAILNMPAHMIQFYWILAYPAYLFPLSDRLLLKSIYKLRYTSHSRQLGNQCSSNTPCLQWT